MELLKEKRTSARNDPAFLLAIIYTIGFYTFVQSLFLIVVPENNKDLIGQMLPVLSMIQGGIVQYFYQKATQATRDKADDTIKKLAETAQTTAATANISSQLNTALSGIPPAQVSSAGIPAGTAQAPNVNVERMDINANTANIVETGETPKASDLPKKD